MIRLHYGMQNRQPKLNNMSLEEDLKRVIPATKEEREYMERAKKKPLPPPEQIERQLRASGAFRGTQPDKRENDSKSGPDKKRGS